MLVLQSKSGLQTYLEGLKNSLTVAAVVGFVVIATPVKALKVRLTPENPQQGDTISVIVETDNPASKPKVFLKQKSYSVFAIDGDRYRALLPTSPLNQPGRLQITVTGDGQTKNLAVGLRDRSFPIQRIRLSKRASQPATKLELERVAAFRKLVTLQKFWQGKFLRPNSARVSAVFGVRRYYNGVFAKNYYHRGVDYAGGYGSPVIAPAAGRVTLVGREAQGFRIHGNTIGIDHGQGVLSIFLHLASIDVREGELVKAGQKIGTIGSSGASTGPHLHWGLYVNGVAVDPVPWRFQGIE